jgi:hypothetical protein|tara:strand:- start:84 stop:440 length:357 start_codon:yes stop_codon:yes gene_type:complete
MTKKLWIDELKSKSTLKTRMHIDESENKYHFEDIQDVEPILEENKKESNLGNQALRMRGELGKHAGMTKVASIPLIVVQQLAQQGIMSNAGRILDKPRFKKWINDPDNRYFRIYQGNI